MICFTSSLTRQLYHFATDFDRVLLQLLGTDIENSLLKYRVSYRHLTFMIETFELLMKSCKKLICYSWIFHVQLHVHLKKWTLKFKLLYPRNYISYFNKICSIWWVNIRIQSLKVWHKFVLGLPWLKYNIFARGLFFIGAPCISVVQDTVGRSHRVQWIFFSNSTAVHTKMGHVSKTTPLLGVSCHPFGKT